MPSAPLLDPKGGEENRTGSGPNVYCGAGLLQLPTEKDLRQFISTEMI